MRPSHAGREIEFTEVAAACGFPVADLVTEHRSIEPLRRRVQAKEGMNVAVVKIAAVNLPRALPPLDGVYVKNRLWMALGHRRA